MTPNKIEEHIDKKIKTFLLDGESYSFVIDNLKDSIDRFQKRSNFVRVSKRYLLRNWSLIDFKKKIYNILCHVFC